MSDLVIIPKQVLLDICNAIREKENSVGKIKLGEIATHISEIETGGGGDLSASIIRCGDNIYLKSSAPSSIFMSAHNGYIYLNPEADESIHYDRLYQTNNGVLLLPKLANEDIPDVALSSSSDVLILSPTGDGNSITTSIVNGYTEVIINE